MMANYKIEVAGPCYDALLVVTKDGATIGYANLADDAMQIIREDKDNDKEKSDD
jgi:hypothetical protein